MLHRLFVHTAQDQFQMLAVTLFVKHRQNMNRQLKDVNTDNAVRTVLVEGALAAKAVNSAMESQQVDKMPEISGNKM